MKGTPPAKPVAAKQGGEKNPSVVKRCPVPSPEDTQVYQSGTCGKCCLKKSHSPLEEGQNMVGLGDLRGLFQPMIL